MDNIAGGTVVKAGSWNRRAIARGPTTERERRTAREEECCTKPGFERRRERRM
jgi:hypothetical protein